MTEIEREIFERGTAERIAAYLEPLGLSFEFVPGVDAEEAREWPFRSEYVIVIDGRGEARSLFHHVPEDRRTQPRAVDASGHPGHLDLKWIERNNLKELRDWKKRLKHDRSAKAGQPPDGEGRS